MKRWHFVNDCFEMKTFCGISKKGVTLSSVFLDTVDCKKCLNKLKKMHATIVVSVDENIFWKKKFLKGVNNGIN